MKIGSTVNINHGVQRLQLIILQEQSTNLQFTALVQTNKASSLSVSLSTSQSVIQVKGKWPDIKRFTNIKKTFANRSH